MLIMCTVAQMGQNYVCANSGILNFIEICLYQVILFLKLEIDLTNHWLTGFMRNGHHTQLIANMINYDKLVSARPN